MISSFTAALAEERRTALLAEAQHAQLVRRALSRRRRPAPRGVPGSTPPPERVTLADGSSVRVRPIEPDDCRRLADAFNAMSESSRRSRFLGSKKYLSAAELRRLTVLDHHHREALIALDGTRCVGVARFARRPEDPHVADVAVTVADDWQRRGLGGALLVRLTRRARAEGLTTFSALIGNENLAARALLRMPGATVTVVDRDVAATEYAVVLPGEGPEPTSDAGPHDRVAA